MTWDIVQFADGSIQLIEHGAAAPDGGTVVAETANPNYITDCAPQGPQALTPWQVRKGLNARGLRDAVEAFVATQPRDVRDGWEFATEFLRDNAILSAAAPMLGIDLDEFFLFASTL